VSLASLLGRERGDLGRPFPRRGTPGGAFCGPAAGRHGLARPSPRRPPQEEASSPPWLRHREHQTAHLRHRRRDRARVEIPEKNPDEASICVESEFSTTNDGLPGTEKHYGFKFPEDNVHLFDTGVVYDRTDAGDPCNFGEVFTSLGARAALVGELPPWECAMRAFAAYVGERSKRGGYRNQKLVGGDHTALGDARATLRLIEQMAEGA
jgi:hypothetical protein